MIQLCAGFVACINHLTQRLMKKGWFGLDFFGGRGVGFGGWGVGGRGGWFWGRGLVGGGGGFGAGAFCNELFFMLSLLHKIMKISNNFF